MAAARRHLRSGEFTRDRTWETSLDERLDRESTSDLHDVPATVVCAFCGEADCGGCESEYSRSGVVALVAWERARVPVLARLWSTARATTRDADAFFELLPDGPVLPALRFAAACELVACFALFAGFLAVACVVAPEWLQHIALDPQMRLTALRLVVLGVPAFAMLAVLAHAAHGLAIDIGATRNGGRPARSRALRFGLYACGWDLVLGPIGAVVVAAKEGVRAALALPGALEGLPSRATLAFLRGAYRLAGAPAKRTLAESRLGAILATLGAALVVVAAIVLVALL